MSEGVTSKLAFTKLVVKDLARQVQFYREIGGFVETATIAWEIGGRPMRETILAGPDGEQGVILLSFEDAQSVSPGGAITGFFTSDLAGFERKLLDAGGSVHVPIHEVEHEGHRMRMAFYADPEGIMVEAIEGSIPGN
jgi:predicted enzyme related to lactoylglutathione lyase